MHVLSVLSCLPILGVQGSLIGSSKLPCKEINIPVSVTANNKVLPTGLSVSSLLNSAELDKLDSAPTKPVSGAFKIGARYCEPTKQVASRAHTLQVLVHGITYTRNYWSGLAPPGTKAGQDHYSWIAYAASQGYPTLSIDRLCNGNSSHPNGISICQLPLEAETLHAIVQKARQGKIPEVGKAFNTILYAGHSYGSLVGNRLSAKHPSDVDGYMLTGFSLRLTRGIAGVVVLPQFRPAAVVSPSQFGYLLTDPSYIMATSQKGAKTVFYYGKYNPSILAYDFAHRQTVTVGEVATVRAGQVHSPTFKGAMYVLNGDEDGIFCEKGQEQSLIGIPGNCSNGYSTGVEKAYPNARKFGFFDTPQTGHCLNNHRTAQESFRAAHEFLAKAGF